MGVQTDVTQRRRLEDEYRQGQKMEAVGRLAGGVAHDFNNLLTIITGYGEILSHSLPPGEVAREQVGEILKAAERASSLTGQLLAFSRKAVLNPAVVDLNAALAESLKMLGRLVGEDIEIATGFAPSLGRVRLDAGQLVQAIVNLAVNARDAMPRGGKLTFETDDVELDDAYCAANPGVEPGRYVLLTASDTGAGMDAETKARIFEPFFTTKQTGRGTGLGMAMVFGFVRQSGGHIAVYSEVDKGTSFRLYFPRVEGAVQEVRPSPISSEFPHGTETILLVEDEDGVRAMVRHVLGSCGYSMLEARNGEEALRVAQLHQGPIDLLLTDVVMPEMGGQSLSERMAELRPRTGVLFMSGYTDDAVVRHGVIEAKTNFLQKPFTPVALARRVRDVLDGLGRYLPKLS